MAGAETKFDMKELLGRKGREDEANFTRLPDYTDTSCSGYNSFMYTNLINIIDPDEHEITAAHTQYSLDELCCISESERTESVEKDLLLWLQENFDISCHPDSQTEYKQ